MKIEESAWLVEQPQSAHWNAHWLCVKCAALSFTKIANEALRFARKEDAEAMCKLYVNCVATEHGWISNE